MDEKTVALGSELNDRLGPFTLLTMRVPEPFDTPDGNRMFRIVAAFARKSAVKINMETLEVKSQDMKEVCITFRSGQDLPEFTKDLRMLADHLDGQA